MTTIQEQFGNKPINLKWNIVRGDTAKLKVEFLENDELTYFNISSWQFSSSAYDYKGDVLDELDVVKGNGYVEIVAPSDITENWGTGFSSVIAELAFDLEVVIGNEIWTPIIGTIVVAADVTGGL
jgi:hypothetical protein